MSNFLSDLELIDNLLSNPNSTNKKRNLSTAIETSNKRVCLGEINLLNKQNSKQNERIEKRNARERNRVKLVNEEFEKLSSLIKASNYFSLEDLNDSMNGKRLSKLKILKSAIEYISYLSGLINESDCEGLDNISLFDFTNSTEMNYESPQTYSILNEGEPDNVINNLPFQTDIFSYGIKEELNMTDLSFLSATTSPFQLSNRSDNNDYDLLFIR